MTIHSLSGPVKSEDAKLISIRIFKYCDQKRASGCDDLCQSDSIRSAIPQLALLSFQFMQNHKISLITGDLKKRKVIFWTHIIDGKIIIISSKSHQIALKKISQERISKYVLNIQNKFKENFQRLYLKIKGQKND